MQEKEFDQIPEELRNHKVMGPLLGMFESVVSRRFLVGAGLGAATGALMLKPQDVFEEVDAAPQDVHGSPNVVVKAFTNKKGRFRLCADGSVIDSRGARVIAGNPTSWPLTSGYAPIPLLKGKPAGSPWVAVDVMQDANGTHILFADGSVRSPGAAKASEPPVGQLQTYTIFWAIGPNNALEHMGRVFGRGLIGSGPSFSFETPFRETPKFILLDVEAANSIACYATDHPLTPLSVTENGFIVDRSRFTGNVLAMFIGEVEIENPD